MKYIIIIFFLLSSNYNYAQRFINNQPFVNTGYKAESLDEISRIPLMKMKIAEENYEKIRSLRKELYQIKEGIKINQDKYHPTIDGINDVLYELLTKDYDLADPKINTIIKQTSAFMEETVKNYNEDVRIYNERKRKPY